MPGPGEKLSASLPVTICWWPASEGPELRSCSESQNGLGWKGPSKEHPTQPHVIGRDFFHQIRLVRALFNLTLNTPSAGTSTTSLGNLCQCLATLRVKKFLPYVWSNSTVFQFKTITPCPVTTSTGKKSFSLFLITPLYVLKGSNKVSQSLFFSRLSKPSLSS